MSLPHETCIHRPAGGLCPNCQAEYEADPTAWIDYGYHSAGLARWEAELDAMDAAARRRYPLVVYTCLTISGKSGGTN